MMSFQPGNNLYTANAGAAPENIEVPHLDVRAPGVNDVLYPVGKRWIYVGNAEYVLLNFTSIAGLLQANWSLLGTSGGALNTLSDNSSVTVTPVSNNIQIAGTSGQITTTAGSGVITLSLVGPYTPTTYTAHSVLLGEGGSSIGTVGPDATSGIALISQGASVDPIFGTVTVPGGGTGATTLTGILTGNGVSAVTANTVTQFAVLVGGAANAASNIAVGATGTLLSGVSGINPVFTASPSVTGSITAGTTLTATLGAITATNGNLVLGTAGNKIDIATGANASVGKSAAMTAGSITIATTAVTAASNIFLTNALPGGTVGTLSVGTIVAATSFVINSSNASDTSEVNWLIIN
jgi:hypothetical protein